MITLEITIITIATTHLLMPMPYIAPLGHLIRCLCCQATTAKGTTRPPGKPHLTWNLTCMKIYWIFSAILSLLDSLKHPVLQEHTVHGDNYLIVPLVDMEVGTIYLPRVALDLVLRDITVQVVPKRPLLVLVQEVDMGMLKGCRIAVAVAPAVTWLTVLLGQVAPANNL